MNGQLRELDRRVEAVKIEAFAPSTRRTRNSQWRQYEQFCVKFHLQLMPMSSENICRYLVWRSGSVSYVTLNNDLSALNVLRKLNGYTTNLREDYAVQLTLKGLRRILGDVSTPMDPLSPQDLLKIRHWVDDKSSLQWGAWTAILLTFRTLLRKGHFLSDGHEDIELLSRQEVHWEPWGIRIVIARSKTIQFGQRHYEAPVSICKGSLCAVSALRRYWSMCPAAPHCSILSDSMGTPLNYKYVLATLKRWTHKAGINKTVGMHSLRRGMATFMKDCGFSLLDIQAAGDWQSLSVLSYLSTSSARRRYIDNTIVSSFPVN